MNRFSFISSARLDSCHVDLQTIFREVLKVIDISIIEGHRPRDLQSKAFRDGYSKVEYPNSKHNSLPSHAVDVIPFPEKFSDREKLNLLAGVVLATAHTLFQQGEIKNKIRWGGDWDSDLDLKDQSFFDLAHYELVSA